MSAAHNADWLAAVARTIRAAAQGPTPAAPVAMHAWLGAGTDAMLLALQHYGEDWGAFKRFNDASDAKRRAQLLALADALDRQSRLPAP